MKRGAPGDILTLAGDAPTRYHQETLLFAAAQGLIDLQRFDPAPEVLREVLDMNPNHLEARCQLALVLNRLGKVDEARALVGQAAQENPGEPETGSAGWGLQRHGTIPGRTKQNRMPEASRRGQLEPGRAGGSQL
jgi:tetratricopeptide (TPR) repeat protein